MTGLVSLRRVLLLGSVVVLATASSDAAPQRIPAPKPAPKLEPVAETRLLMEGLNQSNFRGLERLLKDKPAEAEAWKFARGQALLIAEAGNLLLMRPPRNSGEAAWMDRSTELREAAVLLSRAIEKRDHEASRAGLTGVATACNHCHQSFRVALRLAPFAEGGDRIEGEAGR